MLSGHDAERHGGIVCNTGILGNAWVLERFEPLEAIPSTVRLTTYHSGTTSAERSTAARCPGCAR
jgi:NADPH:quinone reductase